MSKPFPAGSIFKVFHRPTHPARGSTWYVGRHGQTALSTDDPEVAAWLEQFLRKPVDVRLEEQRDAGVAMLQETGASG